jgi:glycosyltransferase involved in cell wall biosynthesis
MICQTYKNLEIILVNDGSTDNSDTICHQYAKRDNRIKVISKRNEGVSSARNSGLEIAKGEFIGFVDGDDYIEDDMYEFLVDLNLSLDADIATCNYFLVKNGNVIQSYKKAETSILNNIESVAACIKNDNILQSVCLRLFKKKCISNIKFNQKYCQDEDHLFNFYAYCNCNKAILNFTPKYYYVQRETSVSNIKNHINYDKIAIDKDILNYISIFCPQLIPLAEKKDILDNIGVLLAYYSIGKINKEKTNTISKYLSKYEKNIWDNQYLRPKFKILMTIKSLNDNLFLKTIELTSKIIK